MKTIRVTMRNVNGRREWRRLLVVPMMFFTLAFAGASQDYPTPTWPLPGLTQPDGQPYYPLWTGDEYMDSARSTGAYLLHEIGITGKGVSAGVIDTPFQSDHPLFAKNVIADASAGFSVVDGDTMFPYDPGMTSTGDFYTNPETGEKLPVYSGIGVEYTSIPKDEDFKGILHGTHVSGTVVGMAPDVGLILLNPSSYKDPAREAEQLLELAATEYALAYLADIADTYNVVAVNNSWGGDKFHTAEEGEGIDGIQREALQKLVAAGVIPVCASGNEATNNRIILPAALPEAIAVGAVGNIGLINAFSNQSDKVVLLAPGDNINSAVPFDEQASLRGTSMATPHVTGAIALIASGARNASAVEIVSVLVDAADPLRYDGTMLVPPEAFVINSRDGVREYVGNYTGKDYLEANTLDDWREYQRLVDAYDAVTATPGTPEFDEAFTKFADATDFGPLEHADFRFLRVDKAYMLLTERRTEALADRVSSHSPIGSEMMHAFSREMGLELDKQAADIFQRLDAQPTETLVDTARRMAPRSVSATMEAVQLGTINLHRNVSRRMDMRRLGNMVADSPPPHGDEVRNCCSCCASVPANPFATELVSPKATVWGEGFGSYSNRSSRRDAFGYDGHFVGASLGIEGYKGDATFGAFGSWADTQADGDGGKGKGDWYSAGLYGGIDKDAWFLDTSLAFSYGKFDSRREIFIPGARFTSNVPGEFITLDPLTINTAGNFRAYGASGRVAGGMELREFGGWHFDFRAEGALAYTRARRFKERGGGVLDLSINSYASLYAEGGAGLAVRKGFVERGGENKLFFSAKVMGLAGGGGGNDVTGSFTRGGSEFRFKPKRLSSIWCVPEVAVRWRINKNVDLSASYAGRFGSRYAENSGSLMVGISW